MHDQYRESESFEVDVSDCEIDLELVKSLYIASVQRFYLAKSLSTLNLLRLKESVIRFEP